MKKGSRENEDSTKDLLQELALLRARVDEVTEQFGLGVKARIDEISHAMASGGAPDAGHVLPEPRLVVKMVRRLRLLSRRQPKGRAKDLKRIQDLVTALSEALLSRK
ncbi:MAG: hypothetical protein ACLQDL_08645 [Spirochaetia bacterium]